MADLFEPDSGTAFYRSKDHIKNLRIRVTLDRVTSANIVPQAAVEKEAGGIVGAGGGEIKLQQQMKDNLPGQKDIEEYVFKWQEKVFCQREVDFYSDSANCFTVLDQKYHDETSLLNEVGRPTKRLFSYVAHDVFTNKDENTKQMTTSPNEKPTQLSERMNNMRYRRNAVARGNVQMEPRTNLIEYEPTDELKKQNHLLSTPVQTMYIMADVSPSSRDAQLEDEVVLCTIKVDTNGVMSIKPDFTKGSKAYKIESSGMGREMFDYTLRHVSVKLTSQEQEKERRMLKELYARHTNYLSSLVGVDFEMPPPDVVRVAVYGEIVSARNFESKDLYVQYFLELPYGWMATGVQQLSGVTQTCTTRVENREEVAHFCFPFNFDLVYKKSPVSADNEDSIPKWPVILVEVLSIDSWHRFRTEGYSYAMLPMTPGNHKLELHCWRPLGRSVSSEMRRFFIGGNPALEDSTYASIPSTFEGNRLSKFGFKTVSTGNVTLKLNILQQSQSFLHAASSKKKVGTIMDKIGISAVQANIANVLDGYQRAKLRMVSARENLREDFVQTLKATQFGDTDA